MKSRLRSRSIAKQSASTVTGTFKHIQCTPQSVRTGRLCSNSSTLCSSSPLRYPLPLPCGHLRPAGTKTPPAGRYHSIFAFGSSSKSKGCLSVLLKSTNFGGIFLTVEPGVYTGRSMGRTRNLPFSAKWTRSLAISTYSGIISAPMAFRLFINDAIAVVPTPMNGSNTQSPSSDKERTNLSISSTGNWQGWIVFSTWFDFTLGISHTSEGFFPKG